ncbi:MAG: glycoside hydrolase family 25 protein [Burkholderiales bacterium]|nr:glycoside hydrolase family 25 protein [Flavobacterium sp.]
MRKPTQKKIPLKRKATVKRKSSYFKSNKVFFGLGIIFISLLMTAAYHYKNGLAYYLGFKTNKVIRNSAEAKHFSDVRNFQLLSKYSEKAIGLDVSQYQEQIDWPSVRAVENTFPVRFVFIRATVGKDKVDLQFKNNWMGSKDNKILRGAYHYYRPNENSLEQAAIFIKTVQLRKGDLPPVLDIESLPENQPIDSLKVGLRRWLQKIDAHYKVKPIIYTGEKYYNAFLKEEFNEYTFWIANYNFFVEDIKDDWLFWQFTERATVRGIPCDVDVNIYNGTPKMLQYLTIN